MNSILTRKWLKVVAFFLCLVPLATLVWEGLHNELSANPIQFLEHATGDWTLRFVAITLAISPFRKILGWTQLIRFRRMVGLFAFFYACLHFGIYVGLDQVLDLRGVLADVAKREYITVGFTAFLFLIPLAITSTARMVRRLGFKRWQLLHRLIYLTAIGGVVHFLWLVKSDVHRPIQYAIVIGLLLGWRVYDWTRESVQHRPAGVVKLRQIA